MAKTLGIPERLTGSYLERMMTIELKNHPLQAIALVSLDVISAVT